MTLITEISLSLGMDTFTILAKATKNLDHANAKIAKLAQAVVNNLGPNPKAAMQAHHAMNIAITRYSWIKAR